MSRDTAKGFYDKNPGDPESGYVTPADAQAALDVVYDDMQADVGGADAINAKLGAAPQGSNSTVQERLEQIEAGVNLAAQSVTSDKIANGTIVDADINAGAAVAPGKIAGTAVTRSDTGTVTSAMIENGTIGDADINAAAAIDKSKIAGVAVTRADVDAIPASMLEDGSITNAKVANNAAIDKAKIAGTAIVSTDSGVVTTGMIADGTIVNGDINPSANIDPAKIAGTAVTQGQSGSVTGPMIANGTISDAQINANAAIGKGKIAGVAVTQADSATVSGAMIKQNTVTGSNLVNDTITATQIAANAVGASELADNAVDTAAIADGAATPAKLATTGRFVFPTGAANGYGFASGAVHLSGTGSPEGVVTAAPGSTWLQTDATTDVKGWIRWIKATGTGNTGWVAGADADTGRRNVVADIDADWAVHASAGYIRLQRVGERVYFEARLDRVTASGSRGSYDAVYTVPSGFAPRNAYNIRGLAAGPSGVQGYVSDISSPGRMDVWFPSGGTWAAGDDVFFTASWYTNDAWPASLPGVAI